MILVTVGTLPFPRLIRKMDEIASQIDEEIIMQIADDAYLPTNAQHFRFRSYTEMRELSREARVVVCHGGVGSILTALEQGAHVVAVPRRREYGELVDDHQQEIVELLAKEGKIVAVEDVGQLPSVLKVSNERQATVRLDDTLETFLRHYVATLSNQIGRGEAH